MKSLTGFVVRNWEALLPPLVVLVVTVLVGWAVERVVLRWLRHWARKTATDLDDIVISALKGPVMLWVVILGLDLAAQSSRLPAHATTRIDKGLLILWILSLTMAGSRLAASLLRHYGPGLRGDAPITTLSQNLVRMFVATIGILLMLNVMGISVTPFLTALGVGGLAVALGLQETLANLFAGLFVSVAGHVRVGDYVKLSTGEEGHVEDVSWRATTLRALANNLIVVPNSKLAQAIVTNYNLPEKRMGLSVPVNVAYDSDPDRVERVLLDEVGRAIGEVPGLLADPAPLVRFDPGFGNYALGFSIICNVAEFTDQYLVQHELRKRIFKRLGAERIAIPFPTRTLYVQDRTQTGRQS